MACGAGSVTSGGMSYFAGVLVAIVSAAPGAEEEARLAWARAEYDSRYVWMVGISGKF